ncbi:MAG: M20 family metallopeptidase [Candidatus Omnitrophota bacterium]
MINRQRLIALTQKLIRIDSQNPPGNESEIARFITKEMRSWGLPVRCVSFANNRPNVIATLKGSLKRNIAAKEAILLSPHMDTVPAGKGWTFPPFAARIKNGKIYGRGATDDKGNLACAMEVMHSLIEDKVRLKRDIIFAATADEETGSQLGIVPLLAKNIIQCKYAVILDSDELDTVITQKGLIHGRVRIFGKKAHGAYNWRGINAIEIAARVIEELKKHNFKGRRHRLLRGPTVNIGTIQGGDKVNMVADECEFSFDLRFLPGMNPKKILAQIEKIVRRQSRKFKILVDNIQDPYEIDCRHPLVSTFVQSARKMGLKAHIKGSEGATVITFFKKKNIPAMATGFSSHGTAHANDEFVRIKSLVSGADVLEQFIKDMDRR